MTALENLPAGLIVLLVAAVIWDLAWRIPALWHAARDGQKVWFGLLLIVNSVGLLPIIYLRFARPKSP